MNASELLIIQATSGVTMGLVVAMGIFFIICTMVFIAVAYFLPEWLGITGKKAKSIMAEQSELTSQEHDSKENPRSQKEQ